MPLFAYTASAPGAAGAPGGSGGGLQRGEIAADSAYQVRAALRRMGLTPLRVRAAAPTRRAADRGAGAPTVGLRTALARLTRSRRRVALVEFYEGLAMLLASGTELSASLDILGEGRASKRSALCRSVAERVRHGAALGDALADRADWFGTIDTALVRAAEQSGDLRKALEDLAEHHARSEEFRGRLAGALAYPALLAVFGLGVVVFLTTTTLPQLASVLADSKVALPGATRALLAIGSGLTAQWWIGVPLGVAAVGTLVWLGASDRAARARLRVPLLGRTLSRGQIGNLSLLLARLLEAGIPLSEALTLAAPSVRNAALRTSLDDVVASLAGGRSVADTLRDSGLFEPVFCRTLAVGEESGELAPTLRTIGERFRDSTRRLTDRLSAVLEPGVILVLAACVGFVVYAAIAPMLRLAQSLNP